MTRTSGPRCSAASATSIRDGFARSGQPSNPRRRLIPARWQRSIRSRLDAKVKVREVLLKAFRVFGPGHLVDPRRGGLLQTKEACPQNIDGEVMQERRQLV